MTVVNARCLQSQLAAAEGNDPAVARSQLTEMLRCASALTCSQAVTCSDDAIGLLRQLLDKTAPSD